MHTHPHTPTPTHTTHLSLVVPRVPPIVQHTITLTTQVPTLVTQDQRLRLSVVMVITEWLEEGTMIQSYPTTAFPGHLNQAWE